MWVGEKNRAVGVHVEHQVAIHGLSLNVTAESTAPFRRGLFVACGARGAQVTSLVEEGAEPSLTTHDVALRFAQTLLRRGLPPLPVESTRAELLFDRMASGVARG